MRSLRAAQPILGPSLTLRARDQTANKKVSHLLADLAYRTALAIVEQHRANRAEDRERRDAGIGRRENSAAYPLVDEAGEKHEAALAPVFLETIARLGQPRLFGRNQLQQIAALIVELDTDVDGVAQAHRDVVARIGDRLIALADALETVAENPEIQLLL